MKYRKVNAILIGIGIFFILGIITLFVIPVAQDPASDKLSTSKHSSVKQREKFIERTTDNCQPTDDTKGIEITDSTTPLFFERMVSHTDRKPPKNDTDSDFNTIENTNKTITVSSTTHEGISDEENITEYYTSVIETTTPDFNDYAFLDQQSTDMDIYMELEQNTYSNNTIVQTKVPVHTKFAAVHCNTTECYSVSSHILGMMDHTSTPCEDIHQYACGTRETSSYIDFMDEINERILGSITNANSQSVIGKFYRSCFDFLVYSGTAESRSSATAIFESMNDIIDSHDVMDILVNLMSANFNPFMDVTVDFDHESKTFLTRIQPPTTTNVHGELSDRSYCIEQLKNMKNGDLIQEYYNSCMDTEGLSNRIDIIQRALNYFNVTVNENDIDDLKEFFVEPIFSRSTNQGEQNRTKTSFVDSTDGLHINRLLTMDVDGKKNMSSSEFISSNKDFVENFIFEFEDHWRNDEETMRRFMRILWAERIFITLVNPVTSLSANMYCLQTAKELLPLESYSALYSSFDKKEIENVKTTINEFAKSNDILFEGTIWDTDIMEENYNLFEQVVLNGDYSHDAFLLGKRLRKMAYSLIGQPLNAPLARSFLFLDNGENRLVFDGANDKFIPLQMLLPFHSLRYNQQPFLSLKVASFLTKLKFRNTKSPCTQPGTQMEFTRNDKSLKLKVDWTLLQDKVATEIKVLENILQQLGENITGFSEDLIWLGGPLKSNKAILLSYIQMQCMEEKDELKNLLNGNRSPNYLWINALISNSREISNIYECSYSPGDSQCPLPIITPRKVISARPLA